MMIVMERLLQTHIDGKKVEMELILNIPLEGKDFPVVSPCFIELIEF